MWFVPCKALYKCCDFFSLQCQLCTVYASNLRKEKFLGCTYLLLVLLLKLMTVLDCSFSYLPYLRFFQILKPSEKKAKYQYSGLNSGRPVTPPKDADKRK